MHRNKNRAFKCRHGVHRMMDETWFKSHRLYIAGCRDCKMMNENLIIRVNGRLMGRDKNLHLSGSELEN